MRKGGTWSVLKVRNLGLYSINTVYLPSWYKQVYFGENKVPCSNSLAYRDDPMCKVARWYCFNLACANFGAFNDIYKLLFFQDGIIVHQTSLKTLKSKNWVHKFWIFFKINHKFFNNHFK